MLEVHSFPLGDFQTNCHILQNPTTKEIVVVDPGEEPEEILAFLKRIGGKVVEIWNTHGHIDHINANKPVADATGAPISIHELEAEWLQSATLNLGAFVNYPFIASQASRLWKGGDELEALGVKWKVYHSPGHSPGLCAIVSAEEKLMIGGDLLFRGSIGRYDFPGSSAAQMTASLRALFNDWGKDDWKVLSGHGDETTVGYERKTNMLVREALTRGL